MKLSKQDLDYLESMTDQSFDKVFQFCVQQITNYVMATNSYVVVRREGFLDSPAQVPIKTESADYINKCFEAEKLDSIYFETDELKAMLERLKTEPVYEKAMSECKACDGDKEVEYKFKYKIKTHDIEGECPVCEGNGELYQETEEVKNMQIPYTTIVRIFNDKYLAPNLILQLLQAPTDAEHVTFWNTAGNHVVGNIGEYGFFIMERYGVDEDAEYIDIRETLYFEN